MKDLVAVTWLDAHGQGTNAYSEHEIPHAAITIVTYGLLLREDPAGVSLANELCSDNTYRGVTFIPTGMVVKVERLRVSKPRKPKPAPLV